MDAVRTDRTTTISASLGEISKENFEAVFGPFERNPLPPEVTIEGRTEAGDLVKFVQRHESKTSVVIEKFVNGTRVQVVHALRTEPCDIAPTGWLYTDITEVLSWRGEL